MPVRLISSVRGMGVAVSVSTSTSVSQLLDRLLVADAEALLLVDDEQAEVLERDVLGQQPVGADDDVDLAGARRPSTTFRAWPGVRKRRQHLDPHRVAGEALAEGLEVLLGQQRGGHEHRHLLAVLHRLERGPDGHLGLAEADVAADQAVHRAWSSSMSALTSTMALSWSGVSW